MNAQEKLAGLILLCDMGGVVLQVIRDELKCSPQTLVGKSFNFIVDRASFKKTLNFLHELRTQGSAIDWQLNLPCQGEPLTLSFGGIVLDEHLVIIGAQTEESVKKLHEELLQINNEQMNMLRAVIKEQAMLKRQPAPQDAILYDELSRLNNELSNAQRELAQKNMRLEMQQRELQEKNAQLHELNASKDKFFSIISHDLRSPFVTLLGYIQRLAQHVETGGQPEQFAEDVTKLRKTAEKLHALLENLLTWSRIQRGAVQYEPEQFDLWDLAEDVTALFQAQAEQKHIQLEQRIPEKTGVFADYQMVNTVLRNLVSNALKFTPGGGRIEIAAYPGEKYVEVLVADTGCGIPPEDLHKLFRIDVQYTREGTEGEPGTGLGLNLCKELVQRNQGEIWVESPPGQGATFRFTLPALAGRI